MTVASAATSHWKKAVKMGLSLFRRGFNSSKCKSMAKMAVARIKLLRNKREAVVRQMRRDIAMLLESGQDATARVRVEHVIREQNIMAANEFIELFCELVVARLSVIAKQRVCPADLKEGISSLIFAAPRCSDIPELLAIRDVFEKKYGKDFVSTATDLRPNAGVNRTLIEKLSIRSPTGETKLKVLKEIAKEYQADWDTTESETELLKPPEKLIEGPNNFVSAGSLPLKSIPEKSPEPNISTLSGLNDKQSNIVHYENSASAAEAAAKFAKKATYAAEAAAILASRDINVSGNSRVMSNGSVVQKSIMKDSSFGNSRSLGVAEFGPNDVDAQNIHRRHSYNIPSAHSDIKYDESDYDEEIEMEEPKLAKQSTNMDNRKIRRHSDNYSAPTGHSNIKFDESDRDDDQYEVDEFIRGTNLPTKLGTQEQFPVRRVHPKLPDYDTLAARFEAQKHRRPPT
ncbi:IST1-like protein [Olea europaea var. sylvestris]|uniref:IST1 homolog n=1 Tax=Olea europaea subsp. europaea TaxID=158383 RepID=A0A8S0VH62_OLEEU|nr:IST1-like protein [Olea europaea var. sylvestris]CAA3028992.1 IST1 homolog [Olea europaea subsp. europaea]